jgi:hypothetical protein
VDTKLGEFEGREVEASQLSLTSAKTTQCGKLADGEVFYAIVMGKVDDIGHGLTTIGKGKLYTRKQAGGVTRMVLVDPADGQRMLDEAVMLADEKFGVRDLFHQDPDEGSDSDGDPDADDE